MKKISAIVIFNFFLIVLQAQTGCLHGDCTNGNGTYKWDNGDTYTGEWANGARSGYGRYDWSNGAYYVGNFKADLLEGEGAYYDEQGKLSMKGKFVNNEFQGVQEANTSTETESEDTSDAWLDEWLNSMDETNAAQEKAKAEALASAKFYDFAVAAQMVIQDFANNFENLKGAAYTSEYDFGDSWYSNIMVTGTDDAMVSSGLLSDHNSWYNVLFTGLDFNETKNKYEEYVKQFSDKVRTGCCTLVYDKYDDYKSDSYESYGTYWLTFLVNDGYNEEIYKDLVVEIEMNSTMLEQGYEIILRVSHLSDKE